MTFDKNKQRQIVVSVSPKLHDSISLKANEAKMSVTAYSSLLFQAAASERVKPGSAPDLDAVVGRVVVLWGTQCLHTGEIGRLIGVGEGLVCQILEAWRAETLGAEA